MVDADAQLMQAFGFTGADILANRQGEIGPSQKREALRNGIVVFAVFAGVGFLLAVALFSNFSNKQVFTGQVAMFFCVAVFIIFSLIGLAFFWGAWSAIKPGAVRCASGHVSFEPTFFKTTFFFEPDDKNLRLCIDGFRLYLKDPDVRHLFIPGAKYNIYFSPILLTVFSVETAAKHQTDSRPFADAPKRSNLQGSKMKKAIIDQRQLAIWAGIIGPMLFAGIFLIEGWLRPGYEPLKMFVSALSLGPRGWIQIANFIVFGILFLIFTRAVAAQFQTGKASRGGLILLTIIAACYLLSGPFVMDPAGTPPSQASLHGLLHGIFGGIVFSLMPISCFVFLRRFREDPRWQFLQWPTLILGTISAVGVILLTVATKLPDTQNIFSPWLGLIQRTAILPFMLWLFIFALGLRRRMSES